MLHIKFERSLSRSMITTLQYGVGIGGYSSWCGPSPTHHGMLRIVGTSAKRWRREWWLWFSHTQGKNDGNIIELLCGVVTWKLEPMRVGERETQMQEREETTLRRSDDNERYRLFIACDLLATLCVNRASSITTMILLLLTVVFAIYITRHYQPHNTLEKQLLV